MYFSFEMIRQYLSSHKFHNFINFIKYLINFIIYSVQMYMHTALKHLYVYSRLGESIDNDQPYLS